MAFSFFGGVHPKENKWYACDKETEAFPEPDIVVIPMAQHIGAPCKPLVAKGDLVTKGQKIGDNQGLCVPVHASVSGKVKAVEPRAHTNGSMVLSVVIENDHLDTLCETVKPRTQEEVDALTPEEQHQQRQRHTDPQSGPRFPAAPHCRSPLGAYFPDAPALVRSDLRHCGKIRRPALAAQGAPSCAAHILQRDFFLLHQRQKPFQIQTAHRKGACQQGR